MQNVQGLTQTPEKIHKHLKHGWSAIIRRRKQYQFFEAEKVGRKVTKATVLNVFFFYFYDFLSTGRVEAINSETMAARDLRYITKTKERWLCFIQIFNFCRTRGGHEYEKSGLEVQYLTKLLIVSCRRNDVRFLFEQNSPNKTRKFAV